MTSSCKPPPSFATVVRGLLLVASLMAVGCQVDVGGQTLPSGYWQKDDVQYYAPASEFKLQREADALKQQAAEQISQPQR